MAAEQRSTKGHAPVRQTDVASVASQQPEADAPTNAVADHLAENRPHGRRQDDQYDTQLMCRCSDHGGGDQHGLARDRQPDALEPYDDAQRHVAVNVEKLDEMLQGKKRHARYKATKPACSKVRVRWSSVSTLSWWVAGMPAAKQPQQPRVPGRGRFC